MGVLVLSLSLVEGAFGIQLNPCTLVQCIVECTKILHRNSLVQLVLQALKGNTTSA
ncbi:hypothetical protein E1A91_A08G113300v1 [Gossypium mustelinum]|uniref:Mon2/Sec7/BIG1-like dimerisation and cyclophilin-binding domain-containing protein n=1 Tax=Gossypium mustelinum TaxID=34275 RepID=A0A5D2Y8E0_GOSMU|nr:hypothetical protein E1A91_A08G113300v1 [Gossypium mustelinum]